MLGPVLPARRLQRTGDRRALKPTALLGACGQPGTFTKAAVRAMAESMERPVIMPLSNPTSQAEATPADLMAWPDGNDILMSQQQRDHEGLPAWARDGMLPQTGESSCGRVSMPINSYLAYPVKGRRDALAETLRALEGCQVIPAVNRDLLVVVTDTPDEVAEEALQGALVRMEFLEGLALVAGLGGADPEPDPPQQAGL